PMKLLVVCLGNICRSPMAEGALRARLDASPLAGRVQVDSAGTGDWHVGEPPDRRAIACAAGHGVDISGLRARQLHAADFDRFDWILCAD
ncbi:low molecular weight protein-tyrosine-phosphatase, partial [Enterobacter hormaechei]|uniref:low molecular weight protein-tyrosine-phosphatase n=1 Tax=Enterobacter hormaechei TaxID=158836 RepID=UPI0028529683